MRETNDVMCESVRIDAKAWDSPHYIIEVVGQLPFVTLAIIWNDIVVGQGNTQNDRYVFKSMENMLLAVIAI